MSAPETTDIPATAVQPHLGAADAPDAPARIRRRLTPRGALLLGGIAIAATVAVVATAVVVSGELERDDALGRLADARAGAVAASAGLRTAQHHRIASLAALEELLTAADAAIAVSGAGIDPATTEALAEARGRVEPPVVETAALAPAGTLDLDVATASELREYAAAQDAYAARLDARADAEHALGARAEVLSGTLSDALAAATAAISVTGSALLADRADAADDATAALQASIDALPTTRPAELATALADYRAAVDAVVASSDRARAPASSGPIGTGVDDPSSLTVVVNKRRALPAGYAPTDLRRPAGVGNALPLRAVAAAAAERMAADMAAAGIRLRMSSGYRSYSRQQTIYNGFVAREGVAGADEHSARPGFSEHQTGLAADFDDGAGCNLRVCFRDTAGGRWLAENAWRYGFILRYGDGWQPIVGYRFEPWHYRFVGETAAAEMHAAGILTLEEYTALPAAPDYG